MDSKALSRAQGTMLGQLIGDSLGSLAEFQTKAQIAQKYPDGIRDLADGGTWNTAAGQPTDDSEMALALARTIISDRGFKKENILKSYQYWLSTHPFDCGMTIRRALYGIPTPESQANGSLMRISPLGIFGAYRDEDEIWRCAREDAALTHINPVCGQCSALFACAIAFAVRENASAQDIYNFILETAQRRKTDVSIIKTIKTAAENPPANYSFKEGWVFIAFQNALWQLIHAESAEEGIINTVSQGGDTDTNGAICGALLGAAYGIEALPKRWTDKIISCRPDSSTYRPRPQFFWPTDAFELAERLLQTGINAEKPII